MQTSAEVLGRGQGRGLGASQNFAVGTLSLMALVGMLALALRWAWAAPEEALPKIAVFVPCALLTVGLVAARVSRLMLRLTLAGVGPVTAPVVIGRDARADRPRRRVQLTIVALMIVVVVVAFLFGFVVADDPIPWLVGLAVGGPFLLGPLVLRMEHWVPLDSVRVPVLPGDPELPPEAAPLHWAGEAELGALGFLQLGSHLREAGPDVPGSVSVAYNAESLELAMLIVRVAQTAQSRTLSRVLSFHSPFEDGTEVVTSNDANPRFLPPSRGSVHRAAFPGLTDARLLYRAHRSRVAELAGGIPPLDPIGGGLERGYYEIDESKGVCRLTYKGAYLAAWRRMWPVEPIRRALEAYRARRVLRGGGLKSEKSKKLMVMCFDPGKVGGAGW